MYQKPSPFLLCPVSHKDYSENHHKLLIPVTYRDGPGLLLGVSEIAALVIFKGVFFVFFYAYHKVSAVQYFQL
jgi:hypothetical protein